MAGRYVLVDDSGRISNVIVWDGMESWEPENGFKCFLSDDAQIGWTRLESGEFISPATPPAQPLSIDELISAANSKRDKLLAEASIRMSPLQDAVDLGEATAADEEMLLAWKRFRIALNAISQQDGYPQTIQWPSLPQ